MTESAGEILSLLIEYTVSMKKKLFKDNNDAIRSDRQEKEKSNNRLIFTILDDTYIKYIVKNNNKKKNY